jgi:hypothetical protein
MAMRPRHEGMNALARTNVPPGRTPTLPVPPGTFSPASDFNRSRSPTRSRIFAILTTCLVVSAVGSPPLHATEPIAWGEARADLRVGLARVQEAGASPTALDLHFRNVGDSGFVLNLGVRVNRQMEPLAISLEVVGREGTRSEHRWGRIVRVGGQIHNYPVYLRPGSTYTLRAHIEDFWGFHAGDGQLLLPRGHWRLRLLFTTFSTPGPEALPRVAEDFPSWSGEAESGVVEVWVP